MQAGPGGYQESAVLLLWITELSHSKLIGMFSDVLQIQFLTVLQIICIYNLYMHMFTHPEREEHKDCAASYVLHKVFQ